MRYLAFFIVFCISACDQVAITKSTLQDTSTCGIGTEARKFDRFTTLCLANFTNPSKRLISNCFSSFEDLYPGMNRQCRAQYRSDIRNYFAANLGAYADTVSDFRNVEDVDSLLDLLDQWVSLKPKLYKSVTAREIYRSDSEKIIALVWSEINSQVLKDSRDGFESSQATIHEVLSENSLKNSSSINDMSFTLSLLAPVFSNIEDQLKAKAEAHDLLCDLSDCSIGNRNSLANAILKLDNIIRSRPLNLDGSDSDSTNRILDLVLSKKSVIQKAMKDKSSNLRVFPEDHSFRTNRTNDLLSTSSSLAGSSRNNSFLSLINSAIVLAGNYKSTARFYGKDVERLDYLPTRDNINRLITTIDRLHRRFNSKLSQHETNRNLLLNQIKTTINENSGLLDYESKILFARQQALSNDINAARSATENEEEKINEYLIGMINIDDDFETFANAGSTTKRVLANNSDFVEDFLDDDYKLSDLYKSKRSVKSKSSRLLKINVTGDWSPTCALSKDDFFGTAANRNLQIGPDGYLLSFSQSKAFLTATSRTKREIEYQDQSTSASVCASAGAGGSAFGVGGSVTTSVCATSTTGVRKEEIQSESTTNSIEERSSASFAEGLRLFNTPFKNITAGALLGVITNGADSPRISDVIEVKQIGRQDVVELPANSEIYFMVNDCSGSTSEGELTVEVQSFVSESDVMSDVVDSLIKVRRTKQYQAKRQSILAQGSGISSDLRTFRDEITSYLSQKVPGYDSNPRIASLAETWISSELFVLEKQHQVKILSRQMDEITWQMASLGLQLERADKSEFINQILLTRLNGQLDYTALQDSYQNLMRFASASMRPVTKLYYTSLTSRFEPWYNKFLDLGLSAENLEYINLINDAIGDLSDFLPEASIFTESGQGLNLLLRVPRPEIDVSEVRGGMPLASDSLRAKIWGYVDGEDESDALTLNLPIDTFYQVGRTTGRLSCRQVRPIIESAAIGLVLDELAQPSDLETFNAGPDTVEVSVGPEIVYSGKNGSTTYRYYNRNSDSNVSSSSLPVQYLEKNSGASLARRITQLTGATNSAIGLSPFSKFEIKGLRSTLKAREPVLSRALDTDVTINEIIIGFRSVVTSTNRNVSWAPACR